MEYVTLWSRIVVAHSRLQCCRYSDADTKSSKHTLRALLPGGQQDCVPVRLWRRCDCSEFCDASVELRDDRALPGAT